MTHQVKGLVERYHSFVPLVVRRSFQGSVRPEDPLRTAYRYHPFNMIGKATEYFDMVVEHQRHFTVLVVVR